MNEGNTFRDQSIPIKEPYRHSNSQPPEKQTFEKKSFDKERSIES